MFNDSSKIQIVSNAIILNDDIFFITKYYQPIIGMNATIIYLTLFNLHKSQFLTNVNRVSILQEYTQITLEKAYYEILALCGVGLLNLYNNKDKNEYVIELINPKSPDEFFKDVNLYKSLENKVSADLYTLLKTEVTTIPFNYKDYDLINKPYKSQNQEVDVKSRKVKVNPYMQYFINKSYVNSEEELNKLASVASNNKLTKLELEQMLGLCTNNNNVNLEQFETMIVLMKGKEAVNKTKIDTYDDAISTYNSFDSVTFLRRLSNGRELNGNEHNIIKLLRNTYLLKDPVINVLLEYVIRMNNGVLNQKFIETIAANWTRRRLVDASVAVEYIKEFNKRYEDKKQHNVANTVSNNIPEWINREEEIQNAPVEEIDNEEFDLFKNLSEV